MCIQTAKETLKALYPVSLRIDIADREYWWPAYDKVKSLLWDTYIDRYRYTLEMFDCDDFALVLHAFVVQERYRQIEKRKLSKDEWLPWAFGQVWGTKFQNEVKDHAVNICVTSDKGVTLIEPQNDAIWSFNPANDILYAVRM